MVVLIVMVWDANDVERVRKGLKRDVTIFVSSNCSSYFILVLKLCRLNRTRFQYDIPRRELTKKGRSLSRNTSYYFVCHRIRMDMRFFTIISMIFMCIIIDTSTAQVTDKTNNESMKTTYHGYKYHGRHGGHAARPQIIHGPIIPCPTGQQHDPNGKCRNVV
ncbi:hypothetical protein V1477_013334 [Vespula maculifrons]|uniref:Uncharacterized protein n=1 Tax=Vespula maculifrons TaxID=7453 RepID=A0ABD2BS05_VESMC